MSIPIIDDPLLIFDEWLKEAQNHQKIKQANAVNLATATRDGVPSNRMVLLKGYSKEGFVFYTNLESKKGSELKENPKAALCFYWEAIDKQVRIEGNVEMVANKEADTYFDSRPLKSRIGAWISKQSQPMESGVDLLKNALNYSIKMKMKKVIRPPFWSGFKVIPKRIEFWQDKNSRLHDRVLFSKSVSESIWQTQRLYP